MRLLLVIVAALAACCCNFPTEQVQTAPQSCAAEGAAISAASQQLANAAATRGVTCTRTADDQVVCTPSSAGWAGPSEELQRQLLAQRIARYAARCQQ